MRLNMKKGIIVITLIMLIIGIFFIANKSYAEEKAIDDKTESKIVEIKDSNLKSLEDYKVKYGSESYGTVAYILNLVRIYSIPICFLGIAVGAIHQYVIGIRKLDTLSHPPSSCFYEGVPTPTHPLPPPHPRFPYTGASIEPS